MEQSLPEKGTDHWFCRENPEDVGPTVGGLLIIKAFEWSSPVGSDRIAIT